MLGQKKSRSWTARSLRGSKRAETLRLAGFENGRDATYDVTRLTFNNPPNKSCNVPIYCQMDPLSFAASLVAVIGATATAAKQLEDLRKTLRDASNILCSTIDEISDLRIVLGACESAVNELHANSTGHDPPTPLADVVQLFERTIGVLNELDCIVNSCLKSPYDGEGRIRVAKVKWLKEKSHVKKLQNQLREVKQDILVLMESHSLSAISGMEVTMQQMMVGTENFHLESGEKLDHITQTLSIQRDAIESLALSTSLINEKLEHFSRTETKQSHQKPSDQNLDLMGMEPALRHGNMLQIRASCYRRTCRPWCSCRCHVRGSIRTPGFIKSFVGCLFLGYSGVPCITNPCNETQCRRRSSARFMLSYQFPEWFWTRALFASFAKSTMFGPEFLLRVQTTIPYTSETYNFCLSGNVKSLQRLFMEGRASPFDVDPDGFSLLHSALGFNQYQICHLLISCGSDFYQEDHTGLSAFHYAWDSILMDPENTSHKKSLLELFPIDEGGLDERQFSRIHKCVLGIIGSSLLDELNISTSAINDTDNVGRTPLYWASCRGDEESVRLLLQFGAKQSIASGKGTNSVLHAAARAGHGGIAMQLLDHGAEINCKGENEMTPLFSAIAQNDGNSCVNILLQQGADVDAKDSARRTPFLVATQNGMLSSAQSLLKHGAHIDHRAEDGWTSLASCIFWNMHESILFLLERGASSTIRTDEGDTLLHVAARYGDRATLDILGNEGLEELDPEARNGAGISAIEISKGRRIEEEAPWHDSFWDMLKRVGKVRGAEREKIYEFTENIEEMSDKEEEEEEEEVIFEDIV